MWDIFEIESTEQNVKFGILKDDEAISNREFLELLRNSESFRDYYNSFLADSDFEAFFWENKPMTDETLDQDYECNIINTDFLAGRSPDSETFSQYFKKNAYVVTFPNLANDAELIVPCPINTDIAYTHIGNFVRKAGNEQIDKLWQMTGSETLKAIGSKPKWLSTSGLGVYWLHIRIDTIPKYYQTSEYKKV